MVVLPPFQSFGLTISQSNDPSYHDTNAHSAPDENQASIRPARRSPARKADEEKIKGDAPVENTQDSPSYEEHERSPTDLDLPESQRCLRLA
jgi:hypothetical protein